MINCNVISFCCRFVSRCQFHATAIYKCCQIRSRVSWYSSRLSVIRQRATAVIKSTDVRHATAHISTAQPRNVNSSSSSIDVIGMPFLSRTTRVCLSLSMAFVINSRASTHPPNVQTSNNIYTGLRLGLYWHARRRCRVELGGLRRYTDPCDKVCSYGLLNMCFP